MLRQICILIILVSCHSLFSQNYFDVKAGSAMNFNSGGLLIDYNSGKYPFSYSFEKSVYVSPYIGVYGVIKESRFFEWQIGLSYMQFKQGVIYQNSTSTQVFQSNAPYERTTIVAPGMLTYDIFAAEIVPTFRIRSFKINLGFFNLNYLIMHADKLNGTKTYYDVIPSKVTAIKNQHSGYITFIDSIATPTNSENVDIPSYNFGQRLKLSYSFGIEYELKIKERVYILGSKLNASFHKNYHKNRDILNYQLFLIYAGIRFPSDKPDVGSKLKTE